MPTEKFHFDFNENAEPVAELHRLRAAMSKRFKTAKALDDYINASLMEKGIVIKDSKVLRLSDSTSHSKSPKTITKTKKTKKTKTAVTQ